MGLLPIFCAGAYLLAAGAGYMFCAHLLRRLRDIAKAAFVAILAFGACSYIGFIDHPRFGRDTRESYPARDF